MGQQRGEQAEVRGPFDRAGAQAQALGGRVVVQRLSGGAKSGTLDTLPLGFTDAAMAGSTLLYAAAAEASKDASEDGRVSGSVIGPCRKPVSTLNPK